jgi:hypothetical protein
MVHLKRRVAGLSKGNGINLKRIQRRRLTEFYAVVFLQDSALPPGSRLAPEFKSDVESLKELNSRKYAVRKVAIGR